MRARWFILGALAAVAALAALGAVRENLSLDAPSPFISPENPDF
jgi:hypothetical protein